MITDTERSCVHAQVHNHFNQERHLVTRQVYKRRRAGVLAEWRSGGLIAAWICACCAQPRRPAVALTEPVRMCAETITTIQKATMIHEEGTTGSPSPSPHGRTRTIVFPARRSVGLKAATATLRVEEQSQVLFRSRQ